MQKSPFEVKEAVLFKNFQQKLSQAILLGDTKPSRDRKHKRKEPSNLGPPCGTRHVYQMFSSYIGASVLPCKVFLWDRMSRAPAPCLPRPSDCSQAPGERGNFLFLSTPQKTDNEERTHSKGIRSICLVLSLGHTLSSGTYYLVETK